MVTPRLALALHDAALENGGMTLPELDRHIDEFIAASGRAAR